MTDSGFFNAEEQHLFLARDAGKVIVSISNEGKLTLGEGYDTDSAAKAFWEAAAKRAVLVRHEEAVKMLYREACVRFRDATAVRELHKWSDLCEALENAFPECKED